MTVWNPNIPLNNNSEKREQRVKHYGQLSPSNATKLHRLQLAKSPAWDVAIKVLIVCLIIDIPILGYFYLVKGVGFWEGVQQLRKEIHTERQLAKNQEVIPVKIYEQNLPPVPQQTIELASQKIEPVMEREVQKGVQKRNAIYSWTNDSGRRVYSNMGFPKDKEYSEPKIEWR